MLHQHQLHWCLMVLNLLLQDRFLGEEGRLVTDRMMLLAEDSSSSNSSSMHLGLTTPYLVRLDLHHILAGSFCPVTCQTKRSMTLMTTCDSQSSGQLAALTAACL